MLEIESGLPRSALIVGCGDVGRRIAGRLRAAGREVTGIVRSRQSAARLRDAGIASLVFDLDAPPFDPDPVPAVDALLWLAPPPAEGTTDPRLRAWLARRGMPARSVYFSTSGVYGDCAGRWIDEDEPLAPATDRARRRADAETALACRAIVLRVPGIYGPGRLPLARLAAGLPVLREADAPWSNRVHAADLAEAALHALVRGVPGRAYHVSDGAPTTMSDYFRRCARHAGLPPPREITRAEAAAALSPELQSYLAESRRLRTDRLRDELGFRPRYPDLDAGLAAAGA